MPTALTLLVALFGFQAPPRAGLGAVQFPTSSAAAAQPHIERGVALLHSFQYDEAAHEFEAGSQVDSSCAMCHWGKAVSRFHPLWGEWPTVDAFDDARRELALAQQIGRRTSREQAYIVAAATFFNAPSNVSRQSRLRAHSRSLRALHHQFPEDGEATAFYALSLVTLASDGVDDLANRREAIRLLSPLLREQPNHPGAAHYLIHAADRPELAEQGLEAARLYGAIAPASSHALHMPGHIFVRLGMWPEAIAMNVRAAEAGARAVMEHRGDYTYQIHAMDYLRYAYLQRGLEARAREQHDALDTVAGASQQEKLADRAWFAGRTAIELHRWQEAADLPVPDLDMSWLSDAYWARTIGAARAGYARRARENLASYRESVAALIAGNDGRTRELPPEARVALLEADGWVAFSEGRHDEALTLMRRATDLEQRFYGEPVIVPAREMLADLLRQLQRPADALREYERTLKQAPKRFNSLFGAATSADAVGQRNKARAYARQLLAVSASDADRPELKSIGPLVAR